MSTGIMIIFYLVYLVAPYTLILIESVLVIIGLVQIVYAIKSMYYNWVFSNQALILQTTKEKRRPSEKLLGVPLIINK